MQSLLKFITCGSVDDGKSTLIGHMLYDAKLIFADQEKALQLDSKVGSCNGEVDYSLLLTFVFFFVFAGNMARIDAARDFFSALMDKNTLLYSALSCQVISNVPSAIMLSQFTQNYAELLVIFSIF